ncbi:putative oxidoreductase [Besnoitia besnoiti]|uniref:Putative oxidoreductase n=1 Tax=Besnoitia besnoiti TaxID=94643 RepID=A0A2A9M5W7_BESBE|nr:putative oxidoreductase [Besnoitia besnoiti]PFH33329.1 putative oxidoreductase [Besnoitia besnoiti]
MKDKVAVVTGGNAGIGMETTRQLALWGVHVLVGCRRVEDVQKVADIVSQEHASNKERAKRKGQAAPVVPGEIHGFYLDLCDFDSVRRFAGWAHSESRGKIDILMNNAGLMSTDKLTMDKNTGFERHFVTNQLGPFLLTDLLLPAVKAAHGRIITISSAAHVTRSATFRPLDAALSPQAAEAVAAAMGRPLAELQGEPISEKNYDSKIMYGTTKMANIWFTKELQRRLAQDPKCRVTAYAAHPGLVRTGLMLRYSEGRITWYTAVFEAVYSMIAPLVLKTVRQGAATQLLLCVSDKEELEPGAYYKDGKANWVDYLAHDLEKQKELWEVSEIVCGLR